MTSIFKNTYAIQDEIGSEKLSLATYPDLLVSELVQERIEDLAVAATARGETVDWGTLSISTRWDKGADVLLISCRVNVAA